MDSGASNYITNDSVNLEQVTNPYGKDSIVVGNGAQPNACKSGISSFPCKNQSTLKLTKVLHAPKVTKNLISVSKLTSDNNILIKFDSSRCYVKDKITGDLLLEG